MICLYIFGIVVLLTFISFFINYNSNLFWSKKFESLLWCTNKNIPFICLIYINFERAYDHVFIVEQFA